jgi:hypothetical protein
MTSNGEKGTNQAILLREEFDSFLDLLKAFN